MRPLVSKQQTACGSQMALNVQGMLRPTNAFFPASSKDQVRVRV